MKRFLCCMALAPLALLWMVACLICVTVTGLCRLLFVGIAWLMIGAEGEQTTMREIWADDWEESITKSLLNSAFCPFSHLTNSNRGVYL